MLPARPAMIRTFRARSYIGSALPYSCGRVSGDRFVGALTGTTMLGFTAGNRTAWHALVVATPPIVPAHHPED
jgi:hypothetical protein